MSSLKPIAITTLVVLNLLGTAMAQNNPPGQSSSPAITGSASGDRVRFTAPAWVVQMRLEVYNSAGKKLFDVEVRGGNIIDWHLQDGQAERLTDDTYLCLITVKSLSGKLSQKAGSVMVEKGSVSVLPAQASQVTAAQSQAIGPIEENGSLTVLNEDDNRTTTIISHNGQEGQITRGRGDLSFRIGDFLNGKDTEQMRLTAEGNFGIGITHPQVRLDVDGFMRASQGIVFPDGSVQFSASRKVFGAVSQRPGQFGKNSFSGQEHVDAAGTGTLNHLAKWTETGGAGTLGDSGIVELNGNIGIGTINPQAGLDYRGATASFFTRDVGTANPQVPQSVLQLGVTNLGSQNVGVGSSFLFFADNTAGAKSFLGRVSGVWENPTAGAEAGAIFFQVRANSADTTASTERMRITSSGNVGIGTSTPGSPLEILNSTGGPALRVANAASGGRVASFGRFGVFQIDSASNFGGRFAVLENGKAGIGNASPTFQLHVIDPSNTGLRVQTNTTGGTVASFGGNGAFQIDAAGVSGGRLTVLENGNTGLGTNAPEQKLHVFGQILSTGAQAGFKFRDPDVSQDWIWHASINNGQTVARLSLNGSDLIKVRAIDSYTELNGLILNTVNIGGGQQSICRDSNFAIGDCSSSLRYKTNIAPFIPGLSLIRQLRPILFDWIKDGMHDVGFGAEDVARINPLFVTYNKGGQVEGVKYDRLSTVFVNAFNEQQSQIEQQQEQIKKQQTALESLKNLVCRDHPNADACKTP